MIRLMETYQLKERNSVSHQIGSSTSLVSWGHQWSHLHTVDSDCPHVQVCLPRLFEGLWWVGVHAKESVLFLMRNIAEYRYYPIKSIISHQSKREVHLWTSRIFFASKTLLQSNSDIINADQGILLTIFPCFRLVVMGPKSSSAVAIKSLIA